MKKVAVITDSNSGITREKAKKLGITVLPMPFFINDELSYRRLLPSVRRNFTVSWHRMRTSKRHSRRRRRC